MPSPATGASPGEENARGVRGVPGQPGHPPERMPRPFLISEPLPEPRESPRQPLGPEGTHRSDRREAIGLAEQGLGDRDARPRVRWSLGWMAEVQGQHRMAVLGARLLIWGGGPALEGRDGADRIIQSDAV